MENVQNIRDISKETLTFLAFFDHKMIEKIQCAFKNKTSVGGIIETAIIGMPCGIGSPDYSIESIIIFAFPLAYYFFVRLEVVVRLNS